MHIEIRECEQERLSEVTTRQGVTRSCKMHDLIRKYHPVNMTPEP